LNINRIVRELEGFSVTLTIDSNGSNIEMSDELKDKIRLIMQSEIKKLLSPKCTCVVKSWKEDSVVFPRGNRPKRFTPEEALEIKSDPISIRKKSIKYDASTKTIEAIMKDRYY